MDIKLITLHSIYNPGSSWQAYGLQEFLIEKGFQTEIIDYRPYYSTIGKNRLNGILRKIIFFRNEKKVKDKYENFINGYLHLTAERYHTFSDLKDSKMEADFFISGSDQLWNMDYDCGNDESYYLAFTNGRKISYATSVGKSSISQREIDVIAERIFFYDMISVREKSTSEILTKALNRKINWVCDPVFLLSAGDYKKYTERPFNERYAVVYLSEESELLDNVVNNLKRKLDCKIVLLGGNRTRCRCDVHIKDLGPFDFISYIENAEIVISSSFHATAFSHIFHKKFGVILPQKNGERMLSLLSLTNLTDRVIKCDEDIERIYDDIDYVEVDKKIEVFVNNSKDVLLNALNKT